MFKKDKLNTKEKEKSGHVVESIIHLNKKELPVVVSDYVFILWYWTL